MTPVRSKRLIRLTKGESRVHDRLIAEEAPVAVEVDGIGYAVMMMTPASLTEFATGFLLTERLADTSGDIADIDVAETPSGIVIRARLVPRCAGRIADRVRHRSSDTGCGLCGIASLEQFARPLPPPPEAPTTCTDAIFASLEAIRDHQPLNKKTGAVHAAAWCAADGAIEAAFEDVGRHNALDKLIGARAMTAGKPHGFILVTSRISFEMVDKALVARAPLLAGISAPTTLAIEHARANRLTLIALARPDAILVASDPHELYGLVAEEGLEPPTRGL